MRPTQLKFPSDNMGRLAGILFLVLLPLVTLNPLKYLVPVWLTEDFILRWAFLALFALITAPFLLRSKTPASLTVDFPNMLFLLLAGWVLISVFNSKDAFDSYYAYRSFLAMVLCWFSLRALWQRWPELFAWFAGVFYWTALLASAWLAVTTAGHFLNIPFFVNTTIPRIGTFPNENIAAGFLGMALLWMVIGKKRRDTLHWVGLGLVSLAWGMTESRGSLVSMVLVVVLYLILNTAKIERKLSLWDRTHWLGAGGVLLLILVILCWKNGMVSRLFNASEADPRSYFRLDVWISSFHMVGAQPLFGFGPGTFADVYPFYRPVGFWNTYNPFAHNEFLQVAAECGLPALFILLLLWWALFREFLPAALPKNGLKAVLSQKPVAELAFYLVLFETLHNMVDFTFHEWSHRLVLMGFVTFALREKKVEDYLKTDFKFTPPAFWTGTAALALFLGWSLGVGGLRDYLARMDDYLSLIHQKMGDLGGAEALARRSLSLRPNLMNPWNSLGAIEDEKGAAVRDPKERERHFKLADEYFEKASQCSPYALDPRANRVQSLLKRGRPEEALDLQRQLVAEGPEAPSNYADLARILLKMRRPSEAIGPSQELIDDFPYFLPGYFLKAEALEALGRRKEALKAFEDARDMLKSLNIEDPSGQVEPNIRRLKGS